MPALTILQLTCTVVHHVYRTYTIPPGAGRGREMLLLGFAVALALPPGSGTSADPPAAPPDPVALRRQREKAFVESMNAEARKILAMAEVAHAQSNGTSMLASLLHLIGKDAGRTSWTAAARERVAAAENRTQHHGRRTFRIHEKEWCYACKCTSCPRHAEAVFRRKTKINNQDPLKPSPPVPQDLKPSDVCPPIVPNPISFPLWATAIASEFLISPIGFSEANPWKDQGWQVPLYMPRQCLVSDTTWTPAMLSARLALAAAAFASDPCTTKCWQNCARSLVCRAPCRALGTATALGHRPRVHAAARRRMLEVWG